MLKFRPYRLKCNALDYQGCEDDASEKVGIFQEHKYTREIATAVVQYLLYRGFDATLVTPEQYDVSLCTRAERVNTKCQQLDKRNICLVSILPNAVGGGRQWMSDRG